MGFTLHFHFEPNDYFSNGVLTKEYEMKCEPSEDDPLSFEGPEVFNCKGCKINWKEPFLRKLVKKGSFFDFFDPPVAMPDPEAEVDEDLKQLLKDPITQNMLIVSKDLVIATDSAIGQYFRDMIIPKAVLFFTGEIGAELDLDPTPPNIE